MNHIDSESPAAKLLAAPRPLVIGHRGYCAKAPENTLPSFALALDAGADLVELDYHHAGDGVPVVIHDATLDHTTDARRRWRRARVRVADKTSAEIQGLDAGRWFDPTFAGTKPPLLTEALEFISGRGGVPLIEHKSGDAATCVRILRECGLLRSAVVISFDWAYLRELHELEPGVIVGALGPSPIRLADGRMATIRTKQLNGFWLDRLAQTGARLVVWSRRVSAPAIELAHRRGLKVWIYTVNNPKLAAQLLDRAVDGIITNEIDAIRSFVARKGSVPDNRMYSSAPPSRVRGVR